MIHALKSVTNMKAQLERAQSEWNMLQEVVKQLTLLFRRPEDGEKRWLDIVKDIPNCFESYVCGAANVCIRNVLGTLQVLYLTMDLHQVATDYDDEGHLAAVERPEEEINGLATTIANELDIRMEKPDEQAV